MENMEAGDQTMCVCVEGYWDFKLNGENGTQSGEQRLGRGEGVRPVDLLLEEGTLKEEPIMAEAEPQGER